MRILFITETFLPKIDGVVTRVTYTIKNLHAMGHETMIIAPEGGLGSYDGAEVMGVPYVRLPFYKDFKVGLPLAQIKEKINEFNPDLIHLVSPFILGSSVLRYAYKQNIPLVTSNHIHISKYIEYYKVQFATNMFWSIAKNTNEKADLALCPSQEMVDEFGQHGITGTRLWRRGVDTELFTPDKYSAEMRNWLTGNEPDAPLIIYAGRLGEEKEIHMLRPILEHFPRVRAAIIGDGPIKEKLQNYFEGTSTVFTGFLKGEKLAQAYASADVFIFPSQSETLGLVALESMAAGTPVIGARAGGITELLEDGKTGYFFTPGSIKDLREKAGLLLNDPEHLRNLSDQAYREAQRWSWRKATEQLFGMYQEVMEQRAQQQSSAAIRDDNPEDEEPASDAVIMPDQESRFSNPARKRNAEDS
jgi:glycosyltransferase involved in cell wall biosynthesis